jgi:hypothetical protein
VRQQSKRVELNKPKRWLQVVSIANPMTQSVENSTDLNELLEA